jgi:hypothetical protein
LKKDSHGFQSGSGSPIAIFERLSSAIRTTIYFIWQLYCHNRAFIAFALDLNYTAVKIDAAPNDQETETGAWTVMGVTAAMKGAKQPLSIGFRNSDSLIADGADNLSSGGLDFETHRSPRRGYPTFAAKQV